MRLFVLFLFYALILNSYVSNVDKQHVISNIIVKNGGFENGKANWTSAGTPTTYAVQTSTILTGGYTMSFDAADADDAFYQSGIALDEGMRGQNLVLAFKQKGGDANLTVQVLDNSSNILLEEVLAVQATSKDVVLNFTTGTAATSLTVKIIATADAAVGYFDDFFVLPASRVNISQVDQASFWGSVLWPGVADCYWTDTSATFEGYDADANCTSPTGANLRGRAEAPATKIPGIKFTNLPRGKYLIIAKGYFMGLESSGTASECAYRFSDGTNVTSPNTIRLKAGSAAIGIGGGSLIGEIAYTTAQSSVTIQIQYAMTGGDSCGIDNDTSGYQETEISVYRFPLDSETAYSAQVDNNIVYQEWNNKANCTFVETDGTVMTDGDCNAATRTIGSATFGNDNYELTKTLPAGTYSIHADGAFQASYSGSATNCVFTVTDGTTTIGTSRAYAGVTAVNDFTTGPAGVITYDGQVTKTFQVTAERTAGSGSCACSADEATRTCSLTIEPVTQAKPQPELIEQTFKQYDLTVTGTNWTTTRAIGMPYRTVDGTWRLKGNVRGAISSAANNITLTISDVTFKNISNYQQAVIASVRNDATVVTTTQNYANPNASTIYLEGSGTFKQISVSFDVELEAKPSWATGVNH